MSVIQTNNKWQSKHDHIFGQDQPTANERRTLIVVVITAVTMVVEVAAGLAFGSMALLADGLHMASHAVALGIATFAYRYARKHAADSRFSFGTGKVNAIAGYSGAILLGVFAMGMAVESIGRFINPVDIKIDHALMVSVLGLLVNGASVLILGLKGHKHNHQGDKHDHHHDHNFRAAYFHVIADALTSFLAIGALLSAKYFGLYWLDPVMGVVGALLITRWAVGLLKDSAGVLLDRQSSTSLLDQIRTSIEKAPKTKVVDLHIWSIGQGALAAIIAIETNMPRTLDEYREMLPANIGLVHVTIEVSVSQSTTTDS